MRLLARTDLERAVEFLESRARPLDLALYRHHFEPGSADPCLELAAFQNPDGGFGHALEPDLRLPDSSVIATTVALQVLREMNATANHPLVESACQFLNATYDPANVNWPIIPANVDDAPHAPWWRHDNDLGKSLSNPRAEIAGYLLDYPTHFPAMMRSEVVDAVLVTLRQHGEAEMEMHDLLCYVRFHQTGNLPERTSARIQPTLATIIEKTVEHNPAQWKRYGLQPLAVITAPDSPFAAPFEKLIGLNLDLLVESQEEDGAWYPNWSWADHWPNVWAQARLEWAGHLTVRNLQTLRTFGRLSG